MQRINWRKKAERSPCLRAIGMILLPLVCSMALGGCGFSATIIDRSDTKTTVENPRLENEPFLQVLLGGAVRDIPLQDIRMVKIDPAQLVNYERRQFYAAQVILRDGSVLSDAGSDSGIDRKCYIGVQNVLIGKHRKGLVRIPLSNVQQIKVDR